MAVLRHHRLQEDGAGQAGRGSCALTCLPVSTLADPSQSRPDHRTQVKRAPSMKGCGALGRLLRAPHGTLVSSTVKWGY